MMQAGPDDLITDIGPRAAAPASLDVSVRYTPLVVQRRIPGDTSGERNGKKVYGAELVERVRDEVRLAALVAQKAGQGR